jgi:hypothetical protein
MLCPECREMISSLDLDLTEDLRTLRIVCPKCKVLLAVYPRNLARQRRGREYDECIRLLEDVISVETLKPAPKGLKYQVAKQVFDLIVTPQNVQRLMNKALSDRAAQEHAVALEKGRKLNGNSIQA